MNEIIIESQEQFDQLPESFDVETRLIVKGTTHLTVHKNPNNSDLMFFNNSSGEFYNDSSGVLYGRSSGEFHNRSSGVLYGRSSGVLYDRSSGEFHNNSSGVFYGRSSGVLFNQSFVRVLNNDIEIKAYENSIINSSYYLENAEFFDEAKFCHDKPLDISFETWLKRGWVVCDGIYERLVKSKELNDGITLYETDKGFVAKKEETTAHGKTIKEAVTDLRFKLSDRDPSQYKDLYLDSFLSHEDMVVCYRVITGACNKGVNDFLETIEEKEEYSIEEVIKLTSGHYGGDTFRKFFKGMSKGTLNKQ